MAEQSDVYAALSYVQGACADARWDVRMGFYGDALNDLRDAARFLEEAVLMVETLIEQEEKR
jgi:hypothetical protein